MDALIFFAKDCGLLLKFQDYTHFDTTSPFLFNFYSTTTIKYVDYVDRCFCVIKAKDKVKHNLDFSTYL